MINFMHQYCRVVCVWTYENFLEFIGKRVGSRY
jgi:hypothetical protein